MARKKRDIQKKILDKVLKPICPQCSGTGRDERGRRKKCRGCKGKGY